MTVARARVRIRNGGLRASRTTNRPPAVVGCTSAGSTDTPTLVVDSDDLETAFGYGKAVEKAALYLEAGIPVLFCKAATVTAGACGSVTHTGTGTATCAVSTGTAADDYDVVIEVTRGGATLVAVTAAVKVSLDGGTTFGPELAVPSSGVLALPKSGIAVTFSYTSGTAFVVGDTYTFASTAPAFDGTTLAAALTALAASTQDHEFIDVADKCDRANATVVKTALETLDDACVYRRALLSARDQNGGESESAWITAISGSTPGFALFDFEHFGDVVACYIDVRYRISGGTHRRSAAFLIGPRLAWMRTRVDDAFRGLAEHPGQTEVDGTSWALAGVEACHHDYRRLTSLDTARFMGLQSHQGRDGYFPTDRTMALATSDFSTVMNARVIVEGATVAQALLTSEVGKRKRLATGGTIDARDAEEIDSRLTGRFLDSMKSYCSSARLTVDRASDITAGTLAGSIAVRPFGYATDIDFGIGLTTE